VNVPQLDQSKSTGRAALAIQQIAAMPLSELLGSLHSCDAGLAASDAAAILKTVGSNRIESTRSKGLIVAVVERVGNPLVLILLFAAAVSAATGDVPSFIIIAVIVMMSVIIDLTQERQALNAANSLRVQVALSAKTLRDGEPIDVPAAEIVPGDVVLLAAGDLVPADCRLMEARDLYVDEALLTGEPYPAETLLAKRHFRSILCLQEVRW
jgi:Mg2+-importing ATPase